MQDMELSEEEQLLIINRLHAVLRPLMLRRTKAEVRCMPPIYDTVYLFNCGTLLAK